MGFIATGKSWFQKQVGAVQEAYQKKAEAVRKEFQKKVDAASFKALEARTAAEVRRLRQIFEADPKMNPSDDADWNTNLSSLPSERLEETRTQFMCSTCKCVCCKVITGDDTSFRGHCMFWWPEALHDEVRREKEAARKAKIESTAAQDTASDVLLRTDRGFEMVQGRGGLDTLNSGFPDGPPIAGPMLSRESIDFGAPDMQSYIPAEAETIAAAETPALVMDESPGEDSVSSQEDQAYIPPTMRRISELRTSLNLALHREEPEDELLFG